MVSGRITVINQSGLHMRPAAILSKTASGLKSSIKFISGDRVVNPKSILNLINEGIKKGTQIEIICIGETEEEDLKVMLDAIEGGLGEQLEESHK